MNYVLCISSSSSMHHQHLICCFDLLWLYTATSPVIYDAPQIMVISLCYLDIDIELQRRDAFLQQLRDLEAQLQFPEKEETEWAQRKRILAKNWASSRNELFRCLMMKNSIPEAGTCCSNCQINVAELRCIECKKSLCSDCDSKARTE